MRIVSLLPSATEILFAIGAGDEVVGVTHECDFPEAARRLPILTASSLPSASSSAQIDSHVRKNLHEGSGLYTLDSDLLADLEPDLIVTQELCAVCAVSYDLVNDAVKRLRSDTRVISLEPSSLSDVFETIRTLGNLTNHRVEADTLITSLETRVRSLQANVARALSDRATRGSTDRPTLLLLEWSDPPMGPGHWSPEVIELAGATPLLASPRSNTKSRSWDEVADSDPDVIVLAPCGFDLVATRKAAAELASNPRWTGLRAYREREIYLLDGNAYVNRPGPRLIDTAEILATILFEDAIDNDIVNPGAWEPALPTSGPGTSR